ncbi:hypothetical protein PAHAL_1G046400 [Panicum hallii]|uniref:Uncharacterized protein n=1 Tax=Panicum hallii TaxID=206008 RepID=A0A2T8KU35_9POAL|nr:hypothetical protein PAHAL_1G046400 [Panicum hallii]
MESSMRGEHTGNIKARSSLDLSPAAFNPSESIQQFRHKWLLLYQELASARGPKRISDRRSRCWRRWRRARGSAATRSCADDASPPCARECKKAATSAASYDGGGRSLQQLAVSGRGDAAEVQASAIIGMARRAAGARPSDRAAAGRRRSLRWFLQRRREARSERGAGASPPSS